MLVRESNAHTHAVVSNAVLGLFKRERALGDQLRQCIDILVRTVTACLRHMRPDGLFHDVLDDDTTFVETNLAQQLAYTLYRLLDLHAHAPQALAPYVDFGELPMAGWEQLAEKMRLAAVENTDEWGLVRNVCGSPRFAAPGTAAEGQAWAIMMEVARTQYLSNNRGPKHIGI
ncbi:hypothetical protein WOLCODRAFT_136409 [Wolfiporia cocos MD-104 SS10]|uniref:Uncharacterized protein n=1 Tax=Wolfiporia cocos (strain MD-104) TaxID=742152 RepID=A0A2H3J934_WOLCO|nr:hypothetical protein WOLCODRAFT_136409 [Wolfiporia cocos MD-104 SS10]